MICVKKFHRSIFWSDFIFKQFWNLEYQDKKVVTFLRFYRFSWLNYGLDFKIVEENSELT